MYIIMNNMYCSYKDVINALNCIDIWHVCTNSIQILMLQYPLLD